MKFNEVINSSYHRNGIFFYRHNISLPVLTQVAICSGLLFHSGLSYMNTEIFSIDL